MTDPTQTLRPVPKPGILDIHAYVGGKAKIEGVAHPVKLSSNENILGCSEHARAAFIEAAGDLQVYPDGKAPALRAAVAAKFGLEPERLIFGAGSDEVFAILNQVFLQPGDNIVQGEHGFAAWGIGAMANGATVKTAPETNLRVDVDALLAQVDERTRLVFVANPSNPTGTWISGAEVERLHAGLPGNVILVIDGAYAEFCDDPTFDDGFGLARHAQNVVVTRTFSKIHGLAALRIGWGYMPAGVLEACDRIRLPFNTSIAAQAAAVAALADEDFQRRSLELVQTWRPWLAQQLGGLGLEVTPSMANFVLVGFPRTQGKTAVEAAQHLERRGYIVRAVGNYGLPDHLRITIGREEHNRGVVEALAAFMAREEGGR